MADDTTFAGIPAADSGVYTPQTQQMRARVAQALLQQGMDLSPIGSPWQGAARVAQAIMGGYDVGKIEREDKANSAGTTALINSILGGGTAGAAAPAAGAASAASGAASPAPASYMDWVRGQEGFRANPYSDYRQTSIGYGTRAQPGETAISEPEARTRLETEVNRARNLVSAAYPNLTPGQLDALGDLTFNTGTAWMNSGLGQAVSRGDWQTAGQLFQQYNNAGGQPNAALTARRAAAAPWLTSSTPWGTPAAAPQSIPGVTVSADGVSPEVAQEMQSHAVPGATGSTAAAPAATAAAPAVGAASAVGGVQISPQARAVIGAVARQNPAAALQMLLPLVAKPDQPTDKQRDYAAYVRDQISRNQPYQSFNEWDLGRLQAGRQITTNNVIQGGEQTQSQELGRARAQQEITIRAAGDKAYETLGRIHVMQQAMTDPGFYSGAGADVVQTLKRAITALGGNADAVSSMETFGAQAQNLVLSNIGGSLGTGISNADRDFIQGTVASLQHTPAGNNQLLTIAERLEQRKIQVANFLDEYASAHGGRIDEGFSAALRQWRDQHPLFTQDEMQQFTPNRIQGYGAGTSQQQGGVTRRTFNPATGQIE